MTALFSLLTGSMKSSRSFAGVLWMLICIWRVLPAPLTVYRSLCPVSKRALSVLACELLRRNQIQYGMIYLQVTRGTAPRWHGFPDPPVKSTLLLTAKHLPQPSTTPRRCDHVQTRPDLRWGRCDWKTTGLLANCLALQDSLDAGYDSPWLVAHPERGAQAEVREGASSNAWIVTGEGALVTHPDSQQILRGCTRDALLTLAKDLQIRTEERVFTVGEALAAEEAFNSSSPLLICVLFCRSMAKKSAWGRLAP